MILSRQTDLLTQAGGFERHMFALIQEPLPGVKILGLHSAADARGLFVKTYHNDFWQGMGLKFDLKEEFFTVSRQGVIRGMHFQVPPHDHNKIVYCTSGAVLDVVLDIRRSSPTFGKHAAFLLASAGGFQDDGSTEYDRFRRETAVVYIPKGFAHGFMAVTDDSCLVYKTDAVYSPAHDFGIRWDSIGFDWPMSGSPEMSERDKSFIPLSDFDSPF
jgi:dTDP-4-dehydrorhamnose 3,5-epimerase